MKLVIAGLVLMCSAASILGQDKSMRTARDYYNELKEANNFNERRAAQLIAEEMSVRELRRAHKLTQERLAETLKIGQDQVSRLEQRSDLLISTLRSYIEAMGGTLTLLAEFPHRKPVVVAGLSTLGPDSSESSPMAPSRVSAKQKRVAFGMTFERTETGRSRTSRQALAVRS